MPSAVELFGGSATISVVKEVRRAVRPVHSVDPILTGYTGELLGHGG
ncbi:hypothetical protein PAN31117_04497 [Pandoraea anapnoica]|uniref:Uncharacterized protein n=1 Tax=Pandoraea anapnoica TaxID=2508301 RepID=A0A5E5AJM6_9BURK|nr:hypothetical protein [Pandoraea anapnoica]VVE72733.1 hypothetical protein PAN31117_04497 [Pandoraea anapnoica]